MEEGTLLCLRKTEVGMKWICQGRGARGGRRPNKDRGRGSYAAKGLLLCGKSEARLYCFTRIQTWWWQCKYILIQLIISCPIFMFSSIWLYHKESIRMQAVRPCPANPAHYDEELVKSSFRTSLPNSSDRVFYIFGISWMIKDSVRLSACSDGWWIEAMTSEFCMEGMHVSWDSWSTKFIKQDVDPAWMRAYTYILKIFIWVLVCICVCIIMHAPDVYEKVCWYICVWIIE